MDQKGVLSVSYRFRTGFGGLGFRGLLKGI